jgi:hypothetical protein
MLVGISVLAGLTILCEPRSKTAESSGFILVVISIYAWCTGTDPERTEFSIFAMLVG